jgi:hypothetical protein
MDVAESAGSVRILFLGTRAMCPSRLGQASPNGEFPRRPNGFPVWSSTALGGRLSSYGTWAAACAPREIEGRTAFWSAELEE